MARSTKIIIISVLIFLGLVFCTAFFLINPKIVKISPSNSSSDVPLNSEIKIYFSGPVNRDLLVPTIYPEVPGNWEYRNPLLSERVFGKAQLFRTLVFVPDEIFQPEIEYKIDLSDKTVAELRDMAKLAGFTGIYSKTKDELISMIEGD